MQENKSGSFFSEHSVYIHQCLGVSLWSTKVLTECLPLLFGALFSIVSCVVICTMLTFF